MVLLEISLFPLGTGESVSEHVAECVRLIDQSGLPYELNAMGTVIEGELPQIMALMQACIELLAKDHERVSCSAKIDYRQGASGRIRGKVDSVTQKLSRGSSASA